MINKYDFKKPVYSYNCYMDTPKVYDTFKAINTINQYQ